jgi:translation initiation factor 2B subunit (eIF-2B alpha/beta/delta family)
MIQQPLSSENAFDSQWVRQLMSLTAEEGEDKVLKVYVLESRPWLV